MVATESNIEFGDAARNRYRHPPQRPPKNADDLMEKSLMAAKSGKRLIQASQKCIGEPMAAAVAHAPPINKAAIPVNATPPLMDGHFFRCGQIPCT